MLFQDILSAANHHRNQKQQKSSQKNGLIIIQIDGLSHDQLGRAIKCGRLPFLNKLIAKKHYRLHHLYSGLPSSTPAVQGELFYGVKCCVPAFSFMYTGPKKSPENRNKKVVTMFDSEVALTIEQELAKAGDALLKEGSSYANVFSGGAKKAHFCSTSMGWEQFFRHLNPLRVLQFILFNFLLCLKMFGLALVELFLAVIDFIRGTVFQRHDFFKELSFIHIRVGVCILLRELVTMAVKGDIERGVPIIHANFLGYDEQAHRRGPDSGFAHWSLKGIDQSIATIWRSAERSVDRNYTVWIYSDHGQEHTIPYPQYFKKDIDQVVETVFREHAPEVTPVINNIKADKLVNRGEQIQRFTLLGGKYLQRLVPNNTERLTYQEMKNKPVTVAMGPVGFIYSPLTLSASLQDSIATRLVEKEGVPLVMAVHDMTSSTQKIRVWTSKGQFYLPVHKETLLGTKHPFLDEVSEDLMLLCQHPYAGDLIMSGWCSDAQAYTFPIENGAHAGPGFNETHAFALLPENTQFSPEKRAYIRPMDLRKAALARRDAV